LQKSRGGGKKKGKTLREIAIAAKKEVERGEHAQVLGQGGAGKVFVNLLSPTPKLKKKKTRKVGTGKILIKSKTSEEDDE